MGLRGLIRALGLGRPDPGPADLANIWTHERSSSIAPEYRSPAEIAAIKAGLAEGLAMYGLFKAELGIGEAARRMAKALQLANYPLSTHLLSLPEHFLETIPFEAIDSPRPFDTAMLFFNPDTLVHFVVNGLIPPAQMIGRRKIGFWHWELPVFPSVWSPAFRYVDEVWASSRFAADTISNATEKPVRVVPHAIPASNIDPVEARRSLGLPGEAFIFLTTFDFNSRIARKNPIATIRAFLDAFPAVSHANTILVIKCHGQHNHPEDHRAIMEQVGSDPRLIVRDELYSPSQMQNLQAACDAFVSLHRSEGFGLNIAECMAAGKVVIATGFSGNCDFMRDDNSLIVPYAAKRVEAGEYYKGEGQWWADPNHDAAVAAMRRAASGSADMRRMGERAREHIRQSYSYESVGKIAIAALRGELPAAR